MGFCLATRTLHVLKLQAETPTLQCFNPLPRHRHVVLKTNNCTMIACNIRQGTAHSAALLTLAIITPTAHLIMNESNEWYQFLVPGTCLSFVCQHLSFLFELLAFIAIKA